MASQMSAAVYDTMAVSIKAGEYDFKANGQHLKFKGFMTLYVEGTDSKEEDEQGMLPELQENEEVKKQKIKDLNVRLAGVDEDSDEYEDKMEENNNYLEKLYSSRAIKRISFLVSKKAHTSGEGKYIVLAAPRYACGSPSS